MYTLEKYFILFDKSRTDKNSRDELVSLFTEDMSFVLNGHEKYGINEWNKFLDLVFENNLDIKHMNEEWVYSEDKNCYETRWAVCGKTKDGKVYTQTGVDIARLDKDGKIKYLENVPDKKDLFEKYN